MRLSTLGGVLLALLFLAPTGAAHVGAVETDPSTTTDEAPLPECIPTCETQGTSLGNVPAVTVIESGATVTWTEVEGGTHTATSDVPHEDKPQLLLGEPTFHDSCLDLTFGSYVDGHAKFRINDGSLEVLHIDDTDAEWQPCPEAIGTAQAGFLLSYHCNVHPRFQQAGILVVPPSG